MTLAAGIFIFSAGIMVWNYHDDDVPAPDAPIAIDVEGIPANQVRLHHYRVDKDTTWREMGAPQQVTDEQYEKLENAGQLKLLDSPKYAETADGTARIQFELPRQGVSFLRLTW